MGAPYTTVAVSGYNANPPVDDGSATAANTIYWATIKTKLNDTLKTAIESINTNNIAAFARIIGGGGVTSTAVDYTVQGSDQGKLVRATASAITITTPDATSVLSPFVFAVLNNSSSTITVDGSGSQTIDGAANITLPAGGGTLMFTDGTNWFTSGIQGTLVGKQLGYGEIINGTIAESNASNATTYAVKTLAGNDPSASDPVLLCFRNATVGTGNYVYRQITAALSLTISSGSTLGASNATAFRVWLVVFDDAGTLRLGAINCLSGTNIYPLGLHPIASSTAEGGAGAADSAQVFYTGTAVTSKAYIVLGNCTYESGITTAGSWNASPTRIQLFGPGVLLPGETVNRAASIDGAVATGSTALPYDDTTPQNTEGSQFMSLAYTPMSAANVLHIGHIGSYASSGASDGGLALFQDSTASAIYAQIRNFQTNAPEMFSLTHRMLAGTTAATTFKVRVGTSGANTITFNGVGGARRFGGINLSELSVTETVS